MLDERNLSFKAVINQALFVKRINSTYESTHLGVLILIISFQDELIKAITARSARQRSYEYSDDFDSDEIGMWECEKRNVFFLLS